jgi:hypothetical protein
MAKQPFELQLWDKDFSYVATVGGIISLTFTCRFNNVSQGEVAVMASNHNAAAMTEAGMRYKLFYKGDLVSTGRITYRKVEGLRRTALFTATLTDDFQILNEVVAWPYPTGTYLQQNLSEHDKYSGTGEGAVRHYFKRNAQDRLGMPVSAGSGNSLGATTKLAARAVTLFDLYEPVFAKRDIGVRLVHRSGSSISLEVYAPGTYPLALTEESNAVLEFSYFSADPSGTRAFIGGAEEAKARIFETYSKPSLEAEYGGIRELFIDARDLGDDYRDALNERKNKLEAMQREEKDLEKARSRYYTSAVRADIAQDAFDLADKAYDSADAQYDAAQAAYKTANNYRTYIYGLSGVTQAQKDAADEARDEANVARGKASAVRSATSSARSAANSKLNSANSTNASDTAALGNAQDAYDTAVSEYNTAAAAVPPALAAHRVELDARGLEKLNEVGPEYGFSVVLGEALNFSYGPDGVRVGDRVTIIAGSITLTDVLSEATIKWNAQDGLSVVPVVGTENDNPDRKIIQAIAKAFKFIRKIGAR